MATWVCGWGSKLWEDKTWRETRWGYQWLILSRSGPTLAGSPPLWLNFGGVGDTVRRSPPRSPAPVVVVVTAVKTHCGDCGVSWWWTVPGTRRDHHNTTTTTLACLLRARTRLPVDCRHSCSLHHHPFYLESVYFQMILLSDCFIITCELQLWPLPVTL